MSAFRSFFKTSLDWITTIPTMVAFGLTLLVGDVALRISRLFGPHPMEVTAGLAQRVLIMCFRISGARITIDRDPAVEKGHGYIFLSNHQSLFDIPIFGGILFSNYPKYVAKRELGKWIPLVSYNLRRGGNALIDRANRVQAVQAIKDLGAACQERGVSAVMFPEGSRSRDGALKQFRSSGTRALLQSAPDLAVVPTAIDGSWRLLENKMLPIPFGTRIRVRFCAPIARTVGESTSEILDESRDLISASLDQWRVVTDGSPA